MNIMTEGAWRECVRQRVRKSSNNLSVVLTILIYPAMLSYKLFLHREETRIQNCGPKDVESSS